MGAQEGVQRLMGWDKLSVLAEVDGGSRILERRSAHQIHIWAGVALPLAVLSKAHRCCLYFFVFIL